MITAPIIAGDPPPWVARYVGLPYAEGGRGHYGLDCWGLLRLVLRERFAVEVPRFEGVRWSDFEPAGLARFMARERESAWRQIARAEHGRLTRDEAEQAGDGVMLRMSGEAVHVGLIVAPGWMLHIEEGVDSVCETYLQARWERRLVAIYRHALVGA